MISCVLIKSETLFFVTIWILFYIMQYKNNNVKYFIVITFLLNLENYPIKTIEATENYIYLYL